MTSEIRYRSARLSRQSVDEGARIIRGVSVSSNEPYARFYGTEILSHSPGSIDLSRITTGASPLLYNHDRDALIGKVSNPQLRNGKLYVDLKFSQSDIGRQMLADVQDEILTECSIGYEVNKFEVDENEETYTATRWTLFECSLVSIPADYTVGVGRAQNQPQEISPFMNTQTRTNDDRLTETQRERHNRNIRELAVHFNGSPSFKNKLNFDLEAENFISEHKTLDEFQAHCMREAFQQARPLQTPDRELTPHPGFQNRQSQSLGGRFLASPEFKGFLNRGGRGKSESLHFPEVTNLRAALSVGGTGVGVIDQTNQLVLTPTERLTISDLFAAGTTSGSTVRYLQENPFNNTASPVAEGAAKPELNLDMEPKDAPVRKLAAWTKITQEMLEDLGSAEQFVSMRLRYAVEAAEEAQLLAGDGTGQNITGIMSTAGIQNQVKGADTTPDAIRKAITLVQIGAKMQPTGIVLHPSDYEAISLLKDANGKYLIGDIFAMTEMGTMVRTPSLWGLPIVVTVSMIENSALVGAFRPGAWLWRRTGVNVSASNSDADNFTKNLVTILAEERLAAATVIPAAFAQITGI